MKYALLAAATVVGLAGVARLKGRALGRLPAIWGPGLLVVAGALVVAAFVLPPLLAGPRPASTATLEFARPSVDEVVNGDQLDVVFDLQGGTIVDAASTDLRPDTGHIHLSLDGQLVSMTYGVEQAVGVGDLEPGVHTLLGEYVAADHAPFLPRVITTVTFRIEA
jgi:hypothetical protein